MYAEDSRPAFGKLFVAYGISFATLTHTRNSNSRKVPDMLPQPGQSCFCCHPPGASTSAIFRAARSFVGTTRLPINQISHLSQHLWEMLPVRVPREIMLNEYIISRGAYARVAQSSMTRKQSQTPRWKLCIETGSRREGSRAISSVLIRSSVRQSWVWQRHV